MPPSSSLFTIPIPESLAVVLLAHTHAHGTARNKDLMSYRLGAGHVLEGGGGGQWFTPLGFGSSGSGTLRASGLADVYI